MKAITCVCVVAILAAFSRDVTGCIRSLFDGGKSRDCKLPVETDNAVKKGQCFCITGNPTKVRTSGCKDIEVDVSESKQQCFRYRGTTKTCTVKSVRVNYLLVDYFGKDRLLPKGHLSESSDDRCVSCNEGFLSGLCSNDTIQLTHAEAKAALDADGIPIVSSGFCSDRTNRKCTSLDFVNCRNIKGVIWLKRTSRHSIVLTGGTETGHSIGTYSHSTGYKLDIRYTNQDISKYIPEHFEYTGIRRDKALMYKDLNGFIYNYEWTNNHHWDILYPEESCIKSGTLNGPSSKPRCLCVSGVDVVVRKSDCAESLIKVSTGRCFKDKGSNKICALADGTPTNFRRVDLNGQDGWIPSANLEEDSSRATYYCDCGRPHFSSDGNPLPFIVGGKHAALGEYPWQVQLRIFTPTSVSLCGGSIISDRWILTAAHCVDKSKNITVKMGGIHLNNAENTTVTHIAEKFIQHKKYKSSHICNDVALIRTATKITFNDYIQPICLPVADDNFLNQQCQTTGWGKLNGTAPTSEILQEAAVTLIGIQRCKSDAHLKKSADVFENIMLCAGLQDGTIGICNGDSGGPLACRDEHSRWSLEGVTSWAGGPCDTYSVYANVSSYVNWIDDNIY